MENFLEELWNEYFAEKCAVIETKEERALMKAASEMHKKINTLLPKEEIKIVEKYTEVLYEIQSISNRKAFFKGCEFTISFSLESGFFSK